MNRKVVSATVSESEDDIIIGFSDGHKQSEILFYPEGEIVQIDGGIVGYSPNKEDWKIIDKELIRFSNQIGIFERQSFDKLARDWVNENVVLAEHCDTEYSDLIESLTKLLKTVSN